MSVRAAADLIFNDLSAAIAAGKLPEAQAAKGQRLLHRLAQPVRVTVMGLPQSGKSSLVNLLLGGDVIPEGLTLPTTQFTQGDSPSVMLTLPDGSLKTAPHANLTKASALDPMFIEVKLPLPALGRISVLEIVAPATSIDMRRAMGWASKRTDIAVWCSSNFAVEEQALWATMPDEVKDHAFLLLTRADVAQQNGHLEELMSRVTQTSADQFNKIMPIAIPMALEAKQADGTVDKGVMQRSGGLSLIQAILRQVDMGLRSTVDQAEMLLHPYRGAKPVAAKPVAAKPAPAPKAAPAKPVLASVPQQPKPEPAAEIAPSMAATTQRPAPVEVPKSTDAPAPAAKRPGFMPKTKKAVAPTASPQTCEAFDKAIAHLTIEGERLAQDLAMFGELTPKALMTASAETIMWLSDFLENLPIKGDPVLDRSRNTALDAADLVQLMQIENNDETSAMDALSLVIQLKHDLEADTAFAQFTRQDKAA